MSTYGFIWVCMGAVGFTNTNAQANNTKRDRNGLEGFDFRPCMAGKFPQKRHICARRHTGVRRYSGGWGLVWMALGGCICTQQTQNKTNRDIYGLTGHNFGKGVGGKLIENDIEVGTLPAQII